MTKKVNKLPVYWAPQPGAQTRAATSIVDETFYGGTRGGGKALPYQTLVLTPFGWTRIGSLRLGSQIVNPATGGTERVIGVFPQGIKKIYKITMDDGGTVEASEDHLWAYKLPNHKRPNTKYSTQREFAVGVLGGLQPNERLNNLRVGTTKDLLQHIRDGFNPRIPLTEPVLYTKNGRAGKGLDPYLLGLFFGDGCFGKFEISSADLQIQQYLESQGWLKRGSGEYGWYVKGEHRKHISQWLQNNCLVGFHSWEKFIPDYIHTTSIQYRLAFIQGLMDTDGYVDTRGRCYYCTTSEQLALGVQQLIWGLGGKAWIRKKNPTYTHKGEKKNGRVAYDLLIQLRKSSNLFRLERKKKRCTDSWNGGYEMMREIMAVEEVVEQDCCCIKVDSIYGLFVTKDFIVTHNSDCAIGRSLRGATKYGDKWNSIILRRKYKDLGELKRRFDELINKGMPAIRTGGDQQTNIVKFTNGPSKGAEIKLTAIQTLMQAEDWMGHQFTEICIDEAPNFPFLGLLVDKMKGSLRSPHGVPCHMFLTGNPGGPGAGAAKMLYVKAGPWGQVLRQPLEDGSEVTRVYIHSVLEDNQILVQGDPHYRSRLLAIRDPALRAAWAFGDWDAHVGQAFYIDTTKHAIKPIWPIPEYSQLYMTFDWGFGAPFSVGWWWVDNDNRLYRFGEWYGWDGKMPNRGIRLTDRDIAEGILKKESGMGILGRPIVRIAGPDCFRKKPDYKGGGQGPATFDEFRSFAESSYCKDNFGNKVSLNLIPGDANRVNKIRQFRNRIQIIGDAMPMLVVYNTCSEFLRTVPDLALDEENPEDLEDGQEDHCYDEASHICMMKPISGDLEYHGQQQVVMVKKQQVQQLDSVSKAAAQEQYMLRRSLAAETMDDPDSVAELNPEIYNIAEDYVDEIAVPEWLRGVV